MKRIDRTRICVAARTHLLAWAGVALLSCLTAAALRPAHADDAEPEGANAKRPALLLFFDSSNEHDHLLDAYLSLRLYPYRHKISYWVADLADGSGDATLAAYGLDKKQVPAVLLLSHAVANGKPVAFRMLSRVHPYESNAKEVLGLLKHVFKLDLSAESPVPEPEPAKPANEETAVLARKALYLGNNYYDHGNMRAAEASYLQAIRFDNKLAMAHYNLGRLLIEARRYAEAVPEFKTAAKLDAKNCPDPVLFFDDFSSTALKGWSTWEGNAVVRDGALELTPPPGGHHAAIALLTSTPWRNYRLIFTFQDANVARPGGRAGFACSVRSDQDGGYWCRTGTVSEIFKTGAGFVLPTLLAVTNAHWNDAQTHRRMVDVTTLVNGATMLRWYEDGRELLQVADRRAPRVEGGISFHTESAFARIDDVLVLRLDVPYQQMN